MEKITGNEFAYPTNIDNPRFKAFGSGLSIRQYFAAMAMQGLCANSIPGQHHSFPQLAEHAVLYADALINELNKPIK